MFWIVFMRFMDKLCVEWFFHITKLNFTCLPKNILSIYFNCMFLSCHVRVSESISTIQFGSIVRPAWLNCCVFVYELCGCGFQYRCTQLKLRTQRKPEVLLSSFDHGDIICFDSNVVYDITVSLHILLYINILSGYKIKRNYR